MQKNNFGHTNCCSHCNVSYTFTNAFWIQHIYYERTQQNISRREKLQQNCLLSDSNYRWKSDNSNDSIQNIKSHELLVQNPITKIDNAQQNQKDCQENFGHAQHWYFCLRTNKILINILDGFFFGSFLPLLLKKFVVTLFFVLTSGF